MPSCWSNIYSHKYCIIGPLGHLYQYLYVNDAKSGFVFLCEQTVHKKTFYYLEQLILKHKLHQNALNIKEIHGRLITYDLICVLVCVVCVT